MFTSHHIVIRSSSILKLNMKCSTIEKMNNLFGYPTTNNKVSNTYLPHLFWFRIEFIEFIHIYQT